MDSNKIIVGTSNGSLIVVLELDENDARILRTFNHHQQTPQRSRLLRRKTNEVNSMEIDTSQDVKEVHAPIISLLAVSPDGQWLASSDINGKTFIFNLDSLQVSRFSPLVPGLILL
jgi:U3 small nucleolar RNA-associated protein 4